jgi:HK97 family phage major capsid protein
MELDQAIEAGFKSVQEKVGAELKTAMEKYEGQLKDAGTASIEAKAEVKALADEFKGVVASVNELAQKQAAGFERGDTRIITAGEEFIKSEAFAALLKGDRDKVRVEVKNTVTSDSTTVFPDQRPGVIAGDFAPLTIRQLFRAIPVSTNMVNSLRELAWTNSAAEVSQGAAKPESDLTFEQYNVPITTVAHWIKVSKQLMEDAPAIMAYIDTRVRDGLAQRIDAQLLNGNGTSPNLSGLTDSGNFTAYTPTSDDLLVDAINRAKYALWAIGRMPDTVIVNPATWGAMERTREGAGTGQYLYGAPGTIAGSNPFGLRVVLSNNMPAAKFLVGALDSSTVLYNRTGAVVEAGYVGSDFTNNLITLRCEERLGLGVERASGILYGDWTTS